MCFIRRALLLAMALCGGFAIPVQHCLAQSEEVRALEAQLSELRQRYTDNHPDVINLKKDLADARAKAGGGARTPSSSPRTADDESFDYFSRAGGAPGGAEPGVGRLTPGLRLHLFTHPGGLHSQAELDLARKRVAAGGEPQSSAFAALLAIARKNIGRSPSAPRTFDVPPYYGDPEGHRKASRPLSRDAQTAYACAIIYQLAPETFRREALSCADKAVEILSSWSQINRAVAGSDGPLVMTYAGVGFVLAAELLSDYSGWVMLHRMQFDTWLSSVYLPAASAEAPSTNNHGDWGILGKLASHHYLGDQRAFVKDIQQLKYKIDVTIAQDGQMPEETGRGRHGIWYTYFALAPLTAAVEIVYNATGEDLYHYKGRDGAGISDALAYLYRFILSPSKWPHFRDYQALVKPTARAWPNNLFEAMAGVYGDDRYDTLVQDARPVTVMQHHFAWSVPTLLRPLPHESSLKPRD